MLSKIELLYQQLSKTFEKLALVLAIFAPIIEASKKDKMILAQIPYIYYLFHFCKDKKNDVQALINFGNKVIAMTPVDASKLDLNFR